MPKGLKALLSGFILSIPALLYLGLHLLTGRREYYFITYIAQALFYFASVFTAGTLVGLLLPRKSSGKRAFLFFFLVSFAAWMASAVVLLLLDLTPLCVGQDNGDGNNNLGLCVLQSVLASLVYTPPVLFFTSLASLAAARFSLR